MFSFRLSSEHFGGLSTKLVVPENITLVPLRPDRLSVFESLLPEFRALVGEKLRSFHTVVECAP
jgi:hypothetical protein